MTNKKSIKDISLEELKADYQKAKEIDKQQNDLEDKYDCIDVVFGNLYGLKKRIQEEIGRRNLEQ